MIRGFLCSFSIISRLSIFFTLIAYVCSGHNFTPRQVFVVTSSFNFLYDSMLFYWTVALTSLAECYVSVKRIEEFLMMPEYKIPIAPKINYAFSPEFLGKMTIAKMPLQKMVCVNEKSRTPCVIFKNVIAQWNPGSLAGIRNVSFVVKTNQLIGINGPVAAGKSSILLTILRELEIDSGELTINGKYCRIITVKID